MDGMKTVLFLCTGNYYRSRFAEEVFNFYANKNDLDWRADSAGLKVAETRDENPGTMSIWALDELLRIGIYPTEYLREPKDVDESNFRSSDKKIAISLSEHKSMMETKFPEFLSETTFWEVEDIELELPAVALEKLVKQVKSLIDQLEDS